MSKFKVGDRVRDAMFTERPIGTVVFVRGDQIKVIWDDEPSGISWPLDDRDFELVQPAPAPSPVITKTVKEMSDAERASFNAGFKEAIHRATAIAQARVHELDQKKVEGEIIASAILELADALDEQ